VDQDQPWQGTVGDAEHRHTLLPVVTLQNRPRRDRKRVLAVLANDWRRFIGWSADGQRHRAKSRVQTTRHWLFQRYRLHPLKQLRLTELGGVLSGGALTGIGEKSMYLLSWRQFPACHDCIPR
jgi:hypothetical protein